MKVELTVKRDIQRGSDKVPADVPFEEYERYRKP